MTKPQAKHKLVEIYVSYKFPEATPKQCKEHKNFCAGFYGKVLATTLAVEFFKSNKIGPNVDFVRDYLNNKPEELQEPDPWK